MIQIRRSAIVKHSAERMFELVNDVASYPTRFTWCTAADVLDQDATHITARLEVRVAGFAQSFTTHNTLERPTRITLALVDGPFKKLTGAWEFMPLGEVGCKVSLALDFVYSGMLMGTLIRAGFQKLADRMVDDFSAEADRVYG
jgi:ribosome-associated toxin RatA of RatAB toxin-antitoxin module